MAEIAHAAEADFRYTTIFLVICDFGICVFSVCEAEITEIIRKYTNNTLIISVAEITRAAEGDFRYTTTFGKKNERSLRTLNRFRSRCLRFLRNFKHVLGHTA